MRYLRAASIASSEKMLPEELSTLAAEAKDLRLSTQELLEKITKDRDHVSQVCLVALGRIFKRNAMVIMSFPSSSDPVQLRFGEWHPDRDLLCVANFGGTSHYNPCLPRGLSPESSPLFGNYSQGQLDEFVDEAIKDVVTGGRKILETSEAFVSCESSNSNNGRSDNKNDNSNNIINSCNTSSSNYSNNSNNGSSITTEEPNTQTQTTSVSNLNVAAIYVVISLIIAIVCISIQAIRL